MDPNIFRAYDIRGIVPTELSLDAAYKSTLAYLKLLKPKNVMLGRDFRTSSPDIHEFVLKALTEQGVNIIDIGRVPTPLLYFSIAHYKKDGGIMITASHLPQNYNGLKLQKKQALPVYDKDIEKIKISVLKNKLPKPKCTITGTKSKCYKLEEKQVLKDYIDHVSKKTKLKRKLKIIIDNGNGACGIIPELIFKKLGCKVYTLYKKEDGTFPNHPADPHQKDTLKDLQKTVLAEKADLGIAYDGDGDRTGIVDSKGRIIEGDQLLMILARKVLEKKKGPVVIDIRSSLALVQDIKDHGGKPILWIAGHAFILDKIFKEKAVFGGEITGHMYFPLDYYYYDDGIYISLKAAELISNYTKKEFCAYIDSLPKFFTSPEIKIPIKDEEKFKKIKEITKYLKTTKLKINTRDGVRIEYPNGWALIRASNTSPVIKIRMEGITQQNLDNIESRFKKILKKFNLSY